MFRQTPQLEGQQELIDKVIEKLKTLQQLKVVETAPKLELEITPAKIEKIIQSYEIQQMSYTTKSEDIKIQSDIKYDTFISSADNGIIGLYSTEANQTLVTLLTPDEQTGSGFKSKMFKRFPERVFLIVCHEDRIICDYEVFNAQGEKTQDLDPKF